MKKFVLTGIISIVFISLLFTHCDQPKKEGFSFAFLTDIHLQPEENAPEGFKQAIDTLNKMKPDFVITGGDLIMDALEQSYGRSDSLYKLYNDAMKEFDMPVYNTMGNHEIYGIYKDANADPDHPEYGEKMFEKRLGDLYYSFEHKDWKFMILNSVEDTKKSSYIGMIDSIQIDWIKQELEKTDTNQPIVISTHIPFITVFLQKYYGSTLANDSSLIVVNSKDVIDLFKSHNLKIVLQGHLHTIEDIYIDGIHFITGGAVSGRWWTGPNRGFEEGFMIISVRGEEFDWEYVDYGWKPLKNSE